MKRVLWVSILTWITAHPALAAEPKAVDKAGIDARLSKRVDYANKLSIAEGDTLFVEKREVVPTKRLAKKPGEYEAAVTGITTPKGLVVDIRVDELKLENLGDKTAVIFRYAIHVDPGTGKGGQVRLQLDLVERTGLANTVVKVPLVQTITVVPAKPTPAELAADFWGYRHYKKEAETKILSLSKKQIEPLTIADMARLPSLSKASVEQVAEVNEFERARRRIWVAHRHLISARTSPDAKIAAAAKAYLDNLERADDQLTGLPSEAGKPEEEVVTLKPERVEPASGGSGTTGSGGTGGTGGTGTGKGTLNPLSSYEPGSEGDEGDIAEPEEKKPEEKKPEEKKPTVVAKADPNAQGGGNSVPGEIVATEDDFLTGRVKRPEIRIPSYPRALLLDDPNIGYAAGVRISYAGVTLGGTNGIAPAFFYYGSASITQAMGAELTVPTVLINLDVQRAQTRYLMGNPLIALKYRFHLPAIEGRQPALVVRARYGIPIAPLSSIPPTTRGAEEFSRPAHFGDPYAFLLEKHDFGVGVSAVYQINIVYIGVQTYGDYFVPVGDSLDKTKFPVISWGASVGALPLGELLGVYLEGRSATLISGPGRTELFTYLGARSHFLDHVEAAAWISLPIGSVHRVSGFQFGADLRFSYDLDDTIKLGKGTTGQDRSILE